MPFSLSHSIMAGIASLTVRPLRKSELTMNAGLVLSGEGSLLHVLAARDDLDDRQAELLGELPVAVVVRRNGHDRAGAVAHQHVVGNEDRDFLAVDRIDCRNALQLDAGLVLVQLGALEVGLARSFLAVRADVVACLRA